MELATDEEKSAMEEKEQKEKDFFAAMEANILNSLSRGVIPGASAQDTAIKEEQSEGTPELERNPSGIKQQSSFRRLGSRARSRAGRPELVRTISTMDESVLQDVIRRQPSFRSVKSGLSKKEPSLQIDDLREFLGSRPGPTRQNDSMCSSSQGSDSILETLEEDVGESTFNISVDSMPDADDLNWNETRALTKLFSITKEMIDADEEHPNKNDRRSVNTIAGTTIRDGNTPTPTRTLRRVTDGDLGRTLARALPRELELEDPGEKKERPSLNVPRGKRAARMLANSGKTAADLLRPPVPTVQRRNTCGTMYIRTTMSAPDKDATIRCVCGVYRSHIISSEHMNLTKEETESLSVFNDYPDNAPGMQNENPTLHEITTFYRDIFFKAQMEADCIIMSLIYVERLIKKTGGRLRPKATNWRSLLFSCMILSSKVWDDLSMWNADFSQSCPPGGVNFSLQRINQLELAILNTLKFNVKVPASEYAKYYFLLRSMLIKSGLGGEDLSSLDPLDVDGARRLQQVSSQFESMSIKAGNSLDFQRSKSLAVESNQNAESFRHPKTKVGLEQVVKM